MQNYQHKLLPDLAETGFGIKYENNLSAYTPPHWHQAMELLLTVKGSVICKHGNSTIHAKPGELYIINSYEVHETRCSRDAVYLCVHILPSRMCLYVPDFDQLSFSIKYDPEDTRRETAYRRLREDMEDILSAVKEGGPAGKLKCNARLFDITAVLVEHFSQKLAVEETTLQRRDMTRLEPILEYTRLHHGEDLSLEGAANAIGLNREYFCRLFKKNMGVSYLHYLYQVRTTAFCRELETSEDPIGELAERHGFRDPKMLGQYFKEIYGCTPSEKRRFFREVTVETE